MHPPLRIEVPDEDAAETLRRHLRDFEVETAPVGGHCEVSIQLRDRNPERRVVTALSAIDAWLLATDVPAVHIHLDGHSYTLHAPPR